MFRGDYKTGFTLIEMMVVLAVIAIIVTLSTPLSNIYRQNQVSSQVQEFVSTLNVARNEAVARGTAITMCIPVRPTDDDGNPLLDPDGNPILSCSGAGGFVDWSAGWIVFVDNNPADCDINLPGGDVIISERNRMPAGFSLRVAGQNCVKYTATGITPDTNGLWTLCDPSGTENFKRGINISVSGRALILDQQRADSEGIELGDCPA